MEKLLVMTKQGTLEKWKNVLCRLLALFERNGFWVSQVNISVYSILHFTEKVLSIFIWLLWNTGQFWIL